MRSRPAVASAEAQTADLYEQYGQDVYRFCSRRLRSHEEAEDAVQNTFLRVYGALRKGIVPEFETAWLYKIAHNVCLSRIAGKTRVSDFETLDDGELLESVGSPHPAEAADELFGLDEALARMPENLRRAILLREWQGLSYAEIAEVLGVSQSAVETLIFRARRHLAQALEGGVKRPAKRVVAGVNLGSAVAALRGWLLGASGAAKLAAAGALAVGLAGGGVLVEQAVVSPASSTQARTQTGVGSGSVVPAVAQPGARSGSQAAVSGTGQALGGGSSSEQSRGGTSSGTKSAGSGTGSIVGRTPTAGGVTPGATPGQTPSGGRPTGGPQQPRKRGSSPDPPSSPALPKNGIPAAPVPAAPTPTTPSAPTLPTATTPGVPAPPTDGATMPTVPTVSVPSVSTPSAPSGSNVSTPTPTVGVPRP